MGADKFTVVQGPANLPQSTSATIYTVSGGKVLIHGVVGEVTSAIQAQADTLTLYFGAGAQATQGFHVEIGDSTGTGKLFGLTDPTGTGGGVNLAGAVYPILHGPIVMQDGAVVRYECSASNTGQVKWTLWYEPIEQGAKVVAN